MIRSRFVLTLSLFVLVCTSAIRLTAGLAGVAQGLSKELSDDAFWRMISEFSEPGGYFPYDNFVSNETTFQRVIPLLKATIKPGGVYFGVGPEQNFTYISALEPRMAFIIDIRRQNMIEHLMHKALIEVSADRADYLSRLFSRKRPAGLNARSSAESLFDAFDGVAVEDGLYARNLNAIKDRLIRRRGLRLSPDDEKIIETLVDAFVTAGPNLTYYGFKPPIPRLSMPTFAELMMQTDGAGRNWSYLASEENFRKIKDLQKKNLIVPLVGDFAGPKAIRAVGQYLKDHGAAVTAIYASNVEQYLFQQGDNWKKYYSSLAALPLDSSSTFIRSVTSLPPACPKCVTVTLVCSVADLVHAFFAGHIGSYAGVIQMSK
ncbi:MAG: hypothetical protein HYU27_08650 [Acidobacteria bacterium]|nr:hypothetical protein [Acidobacteriota bacterium]